MESRTPVGLDDMAVRASTTRNDADDEVQGSICDRCYCIPWEDLVNPSESSANIGCDLTLATQERLRASVCPICNLFGIVVSLNNFTFSHHLASKHDPELRFARMAWCDNPYNGPSISTLSIMSTRSHKFAPHIIATNMEQNMTQSYHRKIYPRVLDINLVKTWMKDCASRHGHLCNPPISARLKHVTNFIDCEQRTIVTRSTECFYVALSYVWGHSNTTQVDRIMQPNSTKIDSRLPQTIEDSISLTKGLGIKYLWVDRYCINQNDAESKHEQIQQMGVIYSGAYLTIIAAAGDNPLHGLPGVQASPRADTFAVRVRSVTLAVHPTRSRINLDILASGWASRAWTFQECYLSRRRLFFTETQAQFVCNSGFDVELDRSTQPETRYMPWEQVPARLGNYMEMHPLEAILPPDVTNAYLAGSLNTSWDGMIQSMRYLEVYSNRRLSYDSDALEAIVGILNTLREREVGVRIFHIWGMPVCPIDDLGIPLTCAVDRNGNLNDCDLVTIGLFWYHKTSARRRQMFPSWSSLAWEGPISWQSYAIDDDDRTDESRQHIKVNRHVAYLGVSKRTVSRAPGYASLQKADFGGKCLQKALKLRAMTVEVRLAAWDVKSNSSEDHGSVSAISMLYNTNTEMILKSHWDVFPEDLDPEQTLKGIIFHSSWSEAEIRDSQKRFQFGEFITHPMIIAKQTRDGVCERVGICWLPTNRSHSKFPVQFRTRSSYVKISSELKRESSILEKLLMRKSISRDAQTVPSKTSQYIGLYDWGKRVCKLESFLLK